MTFQKEDFLPLYIFHQIVDYVSHFGFGCFESSIFVIRCILLPAPTGTYAKLCKIVRKLDGVKRIVKPKPNPTALKFADHIVEAIEPHYFSFCENLQLEDIKTTKFLKPDWPEYDEVRFSAADAFLFATRFASYVIDKLDTETKWVIPEVCSPFPFPFSTLIQQQYLTIHVGVCRQHVP